jgi:tetratricopeptide (TPR) repeat protein
MADDAKVTLNVTVEGDVGVLAVAPDALSVWAAAEVRKIAPQTVAPPVFVSYASDDRAKLILPLVARLEKAGYSVWYDRQSIEGGTDWKREIDQGLRKCSAVIATLTKKSIDPTRTWIRYEHSEAARLFAPIIPVKLEECAIPDHLKDVQAIDMIPTTFGKDGAAVYDDAAFAKLRGAIERVVHRRGARLVDQTPPVTRTFIGRESELREVYDMLGGDQPLAVTSQLVVGVQGMGGIGKTMLVEELVRRLGPRYPGGVIVERRGQSPEAVEDVLRRWAGYALGAEPEKELHPEDVLALLRGAGELLIVIDDVWPDGFGAVRTLLQAVPPDAERILTTRFADGAAAVGAKLYRLERLSEADGLALLRDRLKGKGAEPPEDLLKRLYDAVGGHALALELAAGRCQDTKRLPGQVERLEARIGAYDFDELKMDVPELGKGASLLASLEESLTALQEADARAGGHLAERFAMLGVFAPEAPFDVAGAAAVWGEEGTPLAAEEVERTLDALAGYALVTCEEGRFRQHVILRAYARHLLVRNAAKAGMAAARHAVHYFRIAEAVEEDWQEADRQAGNIAHAAGQICDALGDAVIGAFDEPEPSEKWPDADEDTARAALVMAMATRNYVHDRRVHAGLRWLRAGLAAARLLGERGREGTLLNDLGMWHHVRGEPGKALAYYERALPIRGEVDDRAGLATTLNNMGGVYQVTGETGKALDYFERTLAIREEISDRAGLATTLNNIGGVYHAMGQPRKALDYFERALPIREEVGDRAGLADTLNNIGGGYHAMGQPEKALEYFERALPIREEVGNRAGLAATLNNIGKVYRAMGQTGKALEYLERALPIREEVGDRAGLAATLNNIGTAYHAMGELGKATAHYERALPVREEVGDRAGMATTLNNIGAVYGTAGEPEKALEHHERALAIFREIDAVQSVALLLANIAVLLHEAPALGRQEEAIPLLEEAIAVMEKVGLSHHAGRVSIEDLRRLLAQWRGG